MSNHAASHMLNEVLEVMLNQGFFDNKTAEEKEKFMDEIMKICWRWDGNQGEVIDGIADRLKYCYWCEKVVPVIHSDTDCCSKCNLEAVEKKLTYYKNEYSSLDYFDNKAELSEQEEIDKRNWLEINAEIEKYKKLVAEDFKEEN